MTLGLDLDVEVLQGIEALLEVIAMIDILPITEERAFFALARDFATAGKLDLAIRPRLRLAIDLAVQIRFNLARAIAARLAAGVAIGLG